MSSLKNKDRRPKQALRRQNREMRDIGKMVATFIIVMIGFVFLGTIHPIFHYSASIVAFFAVFVVFRGLKE